MFRHIKIRDKLTLVMLGLSCLAIGLLGTLFYYQFESALEERVLLQLSSVKQLKVMQVKNMIKERVEGIQNIKAQGLDSNRQEYEHRLFDSIHIVACGSSLQLENYKLEMPSVWPQEDIVIQDLSTQHPASVITLAFITPLGEQLLVCVASLPEIQSILMERTGLGQSGESYLVGQDFKMRSRSRFYPQKVPTNIVAKTSGVIRALNGQTGEAILEDYRHVRVFSAYERIALYGLIWVILSEMDYQEALFPLHSLRTNFYWMLLVLFAVILIASYQLARVVVRPFIRMETYLNAMAKGRLVETRAVSRKDEIGRMFSALHQLTHVQKEVIAFAGNIGQGNFEAEYKLLSNNDKLGAALLQMQKQLKNYQETEAKLIRENRQAIIQGEEKERSRLSKEIHDGLGPLLTSLRFRIQAQKSISKKQQQELLHTLDETIREIRRMSNNLMPSVLEDFGAGEAIANLINQLNQSTPVHILYDKETEIHTRIPKMVNIALYRVAQEAINNAIKHAEASEIKISFTEFEDHVGLFIRDNGSGFDTKSVFSGSGLRNMRERIKLVNGTIDIRSGKNGTIVEVEIPL